MSKDTNKKFTKQPENANIKKKNQKKVQPHQMKVILKILFFKDQIEKLGKKEGNMQCGLGVLKHFLYCSDG